ncbi:putative NADH pyrophosphatase/NUDIX hydrolase [Virgisporangium aliadipatigenens]|uniref:NAD(+) diphosphatase n=1 Tax=Virgisporangium aliadipatigenens TaxID=741659 RepID=A0A8J4DTD7_9ACTN|nr:NAD(+) diphosphatase [Virgisporangium aliadipatigenens]GIJ50125.1 putative NADH pyrophosphatase/NUDIX hydrolase [Virgisporangium aliadipatigenens]
MTTTPGVPPLARGLLDRAAHRRTDADWQRDAWAKGRVLVVHKGRALVRDGSLVLLAAESAPEGDRLFLGVDAEETPYFAVLAELPEVEGAHAQDLRQAGTGLDERDAGLLITAVALASWHHRHAFSAKSGLATTAGEAGWTRVTDDGETSWPRTDPAVIVLIHDGVDGPEGRCLLGHNATWTMPGWENRYSCLAGFVEPGESAEATVIREVGEEVGVDVTDLRYIASQPWPFPGSLMLGFFARADPNAELHPDPAEISHARWFTRAEIGAALTEQTEEFGLPSAVSIAHYLITRWHSGQP